MPRTHSNELSASTFEFAAGTERRIRTLWQMYMNQNDIIRRILAYNCYVMKKVLLRPEDQYLASYPTVMALSVFILIIGIFCYLFISCIYLQR